MKLNDMACLNYEIGTETASVTLAGTDLDAIRALPAAKTLMLYDGIGNPLVSLCGFDKIISIRVLVEADACEVVFGRTDTTIRDLQSRLDTVEGSVSSVQDVSDMSSLVFVSLAQSETLDDATIAEHPDLFPKWDENWTGKQGTILQVNGILYRSIHDVGIGQNTNPAETPSMWTRIGSVDSEYLEWSQPLGVHDAYALGDIVLHNGKKYSSTVENNVWEPGVYGWAEMEV